MIGGRLWERVEQAARLNRIICERTRRERAYHFGRGSPLPQGDGAPFLIPIITPIQHEAPAGARGRTRWSGAGVGPRESCRRPTANLRHDTALGERNPADLVKRHGPVLTIRRDCSPYWHVDATRTAILTITNPRGIALSWPGRRADLLGNHIADVLGQQAYECVARRWSKRRWGNRR